MPHSDGTPTGAELSASARRYLSEAHKAPAEPVTGAGSDTVCALIGIGFALLALNDKLDAVIEASGP